MPSRQGTQPPRKISKRPGAGFHLMGGAKGGGGGGAPQAQEAPSRTEIHRNREREPALLLEGHHPHPQVPLTPLAVGRSRRRPPSALATLCTIILHCRQAAGGSFSFSELRGSALQQAGTTPPPEGVPTSDLSDVSESDRLPVPEQGARCTVHGARRTARGGVLRGSVFTIQYPQSVGLMSTALTALTSDSVSRHWLICGQWGAAKVARRGSRPPDTYIACWGRTRISPRGESSYGDIM